MARVVMVAAGVGFAIPIVWLIVIWGFVLTGHESLISGEWFSTVSVFVCPPFFLQFTILAPLLNAGIYAFVAYLVLTMLRRNEQQRSGVH